MVDAVQTTIEIVTTNNNAPSSNMEDLIKKTIADKLAQLLPSIISTTIKELSDSKIINVTIDTSNSITKSIITGDTNEQDAHKYDEKNKSTSNDDTDPTVSLSQTLTNPAKDAHSESESEREDEVEQSAQNKKKSGSLTEAVLIQRCKSV
eukprot:1753846-Ditylum_brightwellii.AAC.1